MSAEKPPGESSGEGRLKRWSRLKQSGEDDPAPPASIPERHGAAAPVTEKAVDTRAGELTERGFVQPLPPLAEPEEGEMPYEAAPADALALLDPERDAEAAALQAFPVRPEDEDYESEADIALTPEQEQAVKDLPPVDSLKKDSDFTPFFTSNVPDFLKRQAYKALWMSSPLFGFRDGLDDYDENFRLIDKLITAADSDYIAGKGYDLEDDKDTDDTGDGDDDGGAVVADAESGDEGDAETGATEDEKAEDDPPKEPRKSDVRPPDNAV